MSGLCVIGDKEHLTEQNSLARDAQSQRSFNPQSLQFQIPSQTPFSLLASAWIHQRGLRAGTALSTLLLADFSKAFLCVLASPGLLMADRWFPSSDLV